MCIRKEFCNILWLFWTLWKFPKQAKNIWNNIWIKNRLLSNASCSLVNTFWESHQNQSYQHKVLFFRNEFCNISSGSFGLFGSSAIYLHTLRCGIITLACLIVLTFFIHWRNLIPSCSIIGFDIFCRPAPLIHPAFQYILFFYTVLVDPAWWLIKWILLYFKSIWPWSFLFNFYPDRS